MHLLIISGTRETIRPTQSSRVITRLNLWREMAGSSRAPKLLMHGACGWAAGEADRRLKGVDAIAHSWAIRCRNITPVPMVVDWRLGLGDGPRRNRDMVEVAGRMQMRGWNVTCVAFPLGESRGTRSFIEEAGGRFPVEVIELGGEG